MLSLKTLANCAGTTSRKVASPSPSKVKAVRCGKAASKRIGGKVFGAILLGYNLFRELQERHTTGSGNYSTRVLKRSFAKSDFTRVTVGTNSTVP